MDYEDLDIVDLEMMPYDNMADETLLAFDDDDMMLAQFRMPGRMRGGFDRGRFFRDRYRDRGRYYRDRDRFYRHYRRYPLNLNELLRFLLLFGLF